MKEILDRLENADIVSIYYETFDYSKIATVLERDKENGITMFLDDSNNKFVFTDKYLLKSKIKITILDDDF